MPPLSLAGDVDGTEKEADLEADDATGVGAIGRFGLPLLDEDEDVGIGAVAALVVWCREGVVYGVR